MQVLMVREHATSAQQFLLRWQNQLIFAGFAAWRTFVQVRGPLQMYLP